MKKLIKYVALWFVISLAFAGVLLYLTKGTNREVPLLLACLSGITFGTVVTCFIYIKRHLNSIENTLIGAVGNKVLGQALCFFAIFTCTTIIGAVLFKLTSVIGNAFISFRTLMLFSAMLGIGGTVFVYLIRAASSMKLYEEYEVPEDGVYIGPVRGDVILFLAPAVSKDNKNAPSLVLSPMSLWDNLKKSENDPDIGIPHTYALLNACRGVKVFERVLNNQERLACVMRAGGWIGAMDSGASKDTILEIYRKCCSLNDDEVVSLTDEELSFLQKYGKHDDAGLR